MTRKPVSKGREDEEDDILKVLKERGGVSGGFGYAEVDPTLLGMVVTAIARKDGQVSFSCTKDGTQAVLTVWYKGYPTKSYFKTPEEMMLNLAFTLDLFLPKDESWDEWRNYAERYKKPV